MSGKARLSVTEAIQRRRSVRAFRTDEVPVDLVLEILGAARGAPSNGNLQPWVVYLLAGGALSRFTQLIDERAASGIEEEPDSRAYPQGLWEPFRSRRRDAGTARYQALGFADKSREGLRMLSEMNHRFFGAPVGLFFYISKRMERHQWCDLGMFMQTVMLLATERGLDTCPQAFWLNWSGAVGEFLDAPADLTLVAGMSLGYADESHPVNQYRTGRVELGEFVTVMQA
jgi:nitroreductase